MTKFHLKSFSFSSSPSSVNVGSNEPKNFQRTPKQYLLDLRDSRFFSLRRTHSQKKQKIDTIPTPKSLPPRRFTSPKTPQIVSLCSPKPAQPESSRHHRQYAVSLSHLPQIKYMANMMDGRSTSLDPESPSEVTRLRRLNPRQQRNSSNPSNATAASSGEILRASVLPHDQIKCFSTSQSGTLIHYSASQLQMGTLIPSFILQKPTSSDGEDSEYSNSTVDPTPLIEKPGQWMANKKKQPTLVARDKKTGLRRSVEILQEVAKSVRDEHEYSQMSLFCYLVFPVIMMVTVAVLVIVPDVIWGDTIFGVDNSRRVMPCIVGGAAAILLRAGIWIVAFSFQKFCDMDLGTVFDKNGFIDQNGSRVGEVDIVTGIFG